MPKWTWALILVVALVAEGVVEVVAALFQLRQAWASQRRQALGSQVHMVVRLILAVMPCKQHMVCRHLVTDRCILDTLEGLVLMVTTITQVPACTQATRRAHMVPGLVLLGWAQELTEVATA